MRAMANTRPKFLSSLHDIYYIIIPGFVSFPRQSILLGHIFMFRRIPKGFAYSNWFLPTV